jgi:hypothetical protein
MMEHQSAVVHQLSKVWSEMISFYRFLSNKRIKVEEMIYQSCKLDHLSSKDIWVMGDTSSYKISSHVDRIRDAHRLGVVEDNCSAGYFAQCLLAVDAANEGIVGMADLILWNRPKRAPVYNALGKKVRKDTHRMEWVDKETYKWSLGIKNACEVLKEARSITFVFDQGADVYNLYRDVTEQSCNTSVQLICRANYDRTVVYGQDTLRMSEVLDQSACLGTYTIDLPALDHHSDTSRKRIQRQARRALIEVRACCVGLLPASTATAPQEAVLPFYLIEAKEINSHLPEGEKPVEWRLLTNIPTHTLEQAKCIIHCYTRRWMVEQLFRTTKSEGFRLEDTEMESVDAIFKQTVMAFHTACKVLQMVYARNRYDSQPIEQIFNNEQIQILEQLNEEYEGNTQAQKNPYPKNQASWAAWVIARLGGWKGYASQRPPGPMTMLWGLERFAVFVQATHMLLKNLKPQSSNLKANP